MIFQELIQDNQSDFIKKNSLISQYMSINENWIPMVFWLESRLNPKAVNKQPGDSDDPYTIAEFRATGLFQCMPSTALKLGITTQQLFNMNSYQQLDYYFKYVSIYKGQIKTFWDLYMSNFFPAGIGKPDDWIIQATGIPAKIIARQNPGFDINGDGMITVGEFKSAVMKELPSAAASFILSEVKKNKGIIVFSILSGLILTWLLTSK
jgi:hypothetical protein